MAKRALPKSGHLQAALRVLWHFCGEVKTFSITSSGFFNILCIGVQRKGSLRRRRKLFHQKTTPSSSKQSFQVAAGETVRKFFSFGSVSFGISSEWIMFDLEDCTAASLEVESGPSTTVSHLH